MSQQTRIDQFYKASISKRISKNTVNDLKKPTVQKNVGRLTNKRKKASAKNLANCSIARESIDSINAGNRSQMPSIDQSKPITASPKRSSPDLNMTVISRLKRSISPTNDVSTSSKKSKEEPITPPKQFYSPRKSSSPGTILKFSKYIPKVSSPQASNSIIPKKLFTSCTDLQLKCQTIEYLNLAKQGAIAANNFDLPKIYCSGVFHYNYNAIDTKTCIKYEVNDVMDPGNDFDSKTMFMVIVNVFSNPINCGYFDEDELDFVYSILTLSMHAQMLLARMLKRKKTWHRITNLKYPMIGPDLKPIFEELASRCICMSNIETEELSTMLELLQVDEMRRICQKLKVDSSGKKEELAQKLQKYSNTKSLFPGAKSPCSVLRSTISYILGYCVCLSDKMQNIFDKILTLLIPNLDPQKSLSDTFFMLSTVQHGKMIFPKLPTARFPIFSSKLHLSNYITAKSVFTDTLNAIERKQWHMVRNYGCIAKMQLANLLKSSSKDIMLPLHVKYFMPEYIWLKLLSKTIDAFKKTTETLSEAVEILNILLEQQCYMQHRKGKWYAEMALIEMFHRKNIETSAKITIQALREPNITEVDRIDLLERAKKILKRKTKVHQDVRAYVQEELDNQRCRVIQRNPIISNTIKAVLMPGNTAGAKTKFFIDTGTEDQNYGSVEDVALYHYYANGFANGIHCEGALPISLFCALFWEEIYDIEVPGAFVTVYSDAPLDLYTKHFYENRKEQIDMKLQILHSLDPETFSNMMENRFNIYSSFVSIMQPRIFKNASCFKEIVFCLGTEGVIGICKKLIDNFSLWKAGFPDLFIWNFNTREHKIVEVKGPGDTLSTKQELWLDYLNQLGLHTEVCIVECKEKSIRHKAKNESNINTS